MPKTKTPVTSSEIFARLAEAAGQVRQHIEADPGLPPAYVGELQRRMDAVQRMAKADQQKCARFEALR